MQLKRLQDVEWLDLPKLELPFFARQWVASRVNLNDFGVPLIKGLDDVVWDDCDHHRHVWDEHALRQLLRRVERAEVFLVHDIGHEPMTPAVLRGKEPAHGEWRPNDNLNNEQRFNVEWMLGYAERTKGIWSPSIEPVSEAGRVEPRQEEAPEPIRVTNPRWEHVDQQRDDDTPDATILGDVVLLKVDVSGAADGTRVSFKIVDTSKSPPSRVGVARGMVEGGVGSAEWTVKVRNKEAKLEFEGEVRRLVSDMAPIPVIKEFHFSI